MPLLLEPVWPEYVGYRILKGVSGCCEQAAYILTCSAFIVTFTNLFQCYGRYLQALLGGLRIVGPNLQGSEVHQRLVYDDGNGVRLKTGAGDDHIMCTETDLAKGKPSGTVGGSEQSQVRYGNLYIRGRLARGLGDEDALYQCLAILVLSAYSTANPQHEE